MSPRRLQGFVLHIDGLLCDQGRVVGLCGGPGHLKPRGLEAGALGIHLARRGPMGVIDLARRKKKLVQNQSGLVVVVRADESLAVDLEGRNEIARRIYREADRDPRDVVDIGVAPFEGQVRQEVGEHFGQGLLFFLDPACRNGQVRTVPEAVLNRVAEGPANRLLGRCRRPRQGRKRKSCGGEPRKAAGSVSFANLCGI